MVRNGNLRIVAALTRFLTLSGLVLVGILSSCSSIRMVEMQTLMPAAITFPESVEKVMIIDNTVQQPDSVGHLYINKAGESKMIKLPSDSLCYDFYQALAGALAESPVFEDVLICLDTIRRDSRYYVVEPFNKYEIRHLCEKYNVDALISIDKFVCNTVYYDDNRFNSLMGDNIMAIIHIELKALWNNQEKPSDVTQTDTLRWDYDFEFVLDDDSPQYLLENLKYATHLLADYMGDKARKWFVPYWIDSKRYYYTSPMSAWKRASVYASAEKWSEAAEEWNAILQKTTKWEQKAKLLSNLAVCSEMTGDIPGAVSLAEQSYELFKSNVGEDNEHTVLQKKLFDLLQTRLKNDETISQQFHENN